MKAFIFCLEVALLLLRRLGTPLNALTEERQEAEAGFKARIKFPAGFQWPPESHKA